MSKYMYFSVHDIKDLAMLFEDKDDYRVVVWNPAEQQEMHITFTGCSNDEKTIHFLVTYTNPNYHSLKWKWVLFKEHLKYKLQCLTKQFTKK